ncbi:MAG: c-type cytochrome [Gammaproteobacteria bacterium]|nr:c-type cytochrome [Gammaproteobacteria bacterium]
MKKLVMAAAITMAATGTTAVLADGKAIYQQACFACHGTGAAGAPKLGDKAAWASRIKQDMATLETHAIKGFSSKPGSMMPPKGGRMDLSDDDIKAAVAYLVDQSK